VYRRSWEMISESCRWGRRSCKHLSDWHTGQITSQLINKPFRRHHTKPRTHFNITFVTFPVYTGS